MIMKRNEYLKFCQDIDKSCENLHPTYLREYMSNTLQVRATNILWLQRTENTGYLVCIDFEHYAGNASFIPQGESKSGYYYTWLEPIDSDRAQLLIDNGIVIGYLDKDD